MQKKSMVFFHCRDATPYLKVLKVESNAKEKHGFLSLPRRITLSKGTTYKRKKQRISLLFPLESCTTMQFLKILLPYISQRFHILW